MSEKQYDLWAGEGTLPEYDPDKVYHAATDKRGHSSTLRIAVPAETPGHIGTLIQQVPDYRNIQDFHRDATIHRLYYWKDRIGSDLPSDWAQSIIQHNLAVDLQEQMKTDQATLDIYRDIMRHGTDWDREQAIVGALDAAMHIRNPGIVEQLKNLR